MTNLPTSDQAGDLDNIAVTRAEFRESIGELLEYVAQALGNVSGTYTSQPVDPEAVVLSGAPTIDLDTIPAGADRSLRVPCTRWVKEHSSWVADAAPADPVDGMTWINNGVQPYSVSVFDESNNAWDLVSGFPSGTRMLFQQTAAPVGWTKVVDQNNKALRVVSGSVTTGGNLDFTTAFSTRSQSGSVSNHTLTVGQIPSHSHGVSDPGHSHGLSDPGHSHVVPFRAKGDSSEGGGGNNEIVGGSTSTNASGTGISISGSGTGIGIQNQGGNGGHNHGMSVNSLDMRVQFVDVIFAQRD